MGNRLQTWIGRQSLAKKLTGSVMVTSGIAVTLACTVFAVFDYSTISDVILHIRHTARQGVVPSDVKKALDDLFQPANQSNLALLFSLRHDFPTEWSAQRTLLTPSGALLAGE